MSDGFLTSQKQEYQKHLNELYVLRWIGSLIYNTNVKKGFTKEPEQLLSLPSLNDEQEKKLTTKEEARKIFNWK